MGSLQLQERNAHTQVTLLLVSRGQTLSSFLMTSLKKWDRVAGSAMVAYAAMAAA